MLRQQDKRVANQRAEAFLAINEYKARSERVAGVVHQELVRPGTLAGAMAVGYVLGPRGHEKRAKAGKQEQARAAVQAADHGPAPHQSSGAESKKEEFSVQRVAVSIITSGLVRIILAQLPLPDAGSSQSGGSSFDAVE